MGDGGIPCARVVGKLSPRIFEWNLSHSGYFTSSGADPCCECVWQGPSHVGIGISTGMNLPVSVARAPRARADALKLEDGLRARHSSTYAIYELLDYDRDVE